MGYDTDFEGSFKLSRRVTPDELVTCRQFWYHQRPHTSQPSTDLQFESSFVQTTDAVSAGVTSSECSHWE